MKLSEATNSALILKNIEKKHKGRRLKSGVTSSLVVKLGRNLEIRVSHNVDSGEVVAKGFMKGEKDPIVSGVINNLRDFDRLAKTLKNEYNILSDEGGD